MKEKLFILLVLCTFATFMFAQNRIILDGDTVRTPLPDSLNVPSQRNIPRAPTGEETPFDTIDIVLPAAKSWLLNPQSGERIFIPLDSARYNYQQTTVPEGYSVAPGYLGPIGSPYISKLFFEREITSQFPFYDAYGPYKIGPALQPFFNTRVPYSKLDYQTAGSRQLREQRLRGLLTANLNQKLNLALDLDFINAKGFYKSQENKHNDITLSGNYISDRFEAHAYASTSTIQQFENGGIADETFIREPESVGQSFQTIDIPVKFTNTWNKIKTDQFFISGKYNVGYVADSTKESVFVPVASLSFSTHYQKQHRRFLSHDTARVVIDGRPMQNIDQFYPNRYYNTAVDDSTTFTSFKNTAALSLREGFKPWVKFGLTGYIEHDIRKFTLLDSLNGTIDRRLHTENSLLLGGILNKTQGEFLRFNLQAQVGLLGADLGKMVLQGNVETAYNIAGRRTTLSGEAYVKNLPATYLQKHYHSKYFWWNQNFGDTRRVYLGGKLHVPFTNTTLSAGVENIQNHIYFDKDRNIAQHADNVQVLMARVDQNLKLGIFNWNNQVVYQTTSNNEVIPVPTLSLYSNMFLKALIVNELTLQFGVDAHYHTSYFSPGYEPALLQFYNQREKEIGNYPIATIYANMHLKQTRFFVMYYNAAAKVIKPREYFALPGYPVNPTMFRFGVSVDLHN